MAHFEKERKWTKEAGDGPFIKWKRGSMIKTNHFKSNVCQLKFDIQSWKLPEADDALTL